MLKDEQDIKRSMGVLRIFLKKEREKIESKEIWKIN